MVTKRKSSKRKPAVACATTKGHLKAADRNALPAYAFGLPDRREFPMYRMEHGRVVPDAAHARNAKARAAQARHKGHISADEQRLIDAKADRVLVQCGHAAMHAPRARHAAASHEHHRSVHQTGHSSHAAGPHHSDPIKSGDVIQDKRGALYTAADRFNKDFGPGQPSTGWLAYALDTTRHTTRGHTYHVFDHQIAGFGSNAASVAPVHGMHEDRLVSTMPQSEVEMQLRRHQPGVIGRGMAEDSELYTKGYVSRGPHKVVYVVIADRAHGRRGGETARGEVQYTPYTGTRRLRILGYALPQWELVHAGLAPDGSSVETADRLAREAAADEVQPS